MNFNVRAETRRGVEYCLISIRFVRGKSTLQRFPRRVANIVDDFKWMYLSTYLRPHPPVPRV